MRQALEIEIQHRHAVIEGLAEIAGEQARHEMPVLLPQRLIEAELAADVLDVLGLAPGSTSRLTDRR